MGGAQLRAGAGQEGTFGGKERETWPKLREANPSRRVPEGMSVFHEIQVRARCGLHALNNMCQGPVFKEEELQAIARHVEEEERKIRLEEPVPHSNGAGWFSLETLSVALQQHGRNTFSAEPPKGIMNERTGTGWLVYDHPRRHWWTFRRAAEGVWVHDSLDREPWLVGQIEDFECHMKETEFTVFKVAGGEQRQGVDTPMTGELAGNQRRLSLVEFQIQADETLARALWEEELARSLSETPPPFAGFSPCTPKKEGETDKGDTRQQKEQGTGRAGTGGQGIPLPQAYLSPRSSTSSEV